MTNLGDYAIRTGEGVTFFDGDIGFWSLKLVLQFTTVFSPGVLILRPFALIVGFNRTGQWQLLFDFFLQPISFIIVENYSVWKCPTQALFVLFTPMIEA